MNTKTLVKCWVPLGLKEKIKAVAAQRLVSDADVVRAALLAYIDTHSSEALSAPEAGK
jgi:hypothetical protein